MSVLRGSFWGILNQHKGMRLGDGPIFRLTSCGQVPEGDTKSRQTEGAKRAESVFLCVSRGHGGPGGCREGGHVHVLPQKPRKEATWKVQIWGRATGSQGQPSLAYSPARLAESKEELKSFLMKVKGE